MSMNPDSNNHLSPAVANPNQDAPARYGGQVSALPPRQDMFAIDVLAGGPTAEDRTAQPAVFTGGNTGRGLGGEALGLEPGKTQAPGYETGERIGI